MQLPLAGRHFQGLNFGSPGAVKPWKVSLLYRKNKKITKILWKIKKLTPGAPPGYPFLPLGYFPCQTPDFRAADTHNIKNAYFSGAKTPLVSCDLWLLVGLVPPRARRRIYPPFLPPTPRAGLQEDVRMWQAQTPSNYLLLTTYYLLLTIYYLLLNT